MSDVSLPPNPLSPPNPEKFQPPQQDLSVSTFPPNPPLSDSPLDVETYNEVTSPQPSPTIENSLPKLSARLSNTSLNANGPSITAPTPDDGAGPPPVGTRAPANSVANSVSGGGGGGGGRERNVKSTLKDLAAQ